MFVIVGIMVVFGAVVGGYLMEHGNLRVLVQPAELIIIGGAGSGTVLVANPLHVLKKIVAGLGGVFGGSKYTKQRYLDMLKTLYDLFNKARREGLIALESDVEEAEKSPIFAKNAALLKDHHLLDFVCDTMRMAVTGGVEPFDVDQMMEVDMEVHHHGATQPIAALSTMADSLPGLGIVAAVLGVVITMGALAANMAKAADEEHAMYHVVRVVMLAFLKGTSPVMAVKIGRRAIPSHVRPSFQEAEKAIRSSGSGGEAAAAASAG